MYGVGSVRRQITRRNFMASASAGAATLIGTQVRANALAQAAKPLARAAIGPASSEALKPSLTPHPPHAKFSELPLSSIQPQGWIRAFMVKAKNGLTGHVDEIGGAPFNTYGWGGPTLAALPPDWWSYEQNAYWCEIGR